MSQFPRMSSRILPFHIRIPRAVLVLCVAHVPYHNITPKTVFERTFYCLPEVQWHFFQGQCGLVVKPELAENVKPATFCHFWITFLQGGHIFEKLYSLSFPWDFQGIFKFFPEKHEREKFAGMHFHWWLCHIFYIFPEFSRFFHKN